MTGLVRTWLLGITGAAILAALAAAMAPDGAVKKAGKLAGGLLLFLAVVRPIASIDPEELARAVEDDTGWDIALEASAQQTREDMKSIIAGQAAAYILDKATAAELPVQSVEVTVSDGDEAYPLPQSVVVTGSLDEEQRRLLTGMIRQNFAIPEARQEYRTEEEGSYG